MLPIGLTVPVSCQLSCVWADPQLIALEFMLSFVNLWNILAAEVSKVPKPPAQCTEENSHPVFTLKYSL